MALKQEESRTQEGAAQSGRVAQTQQVTKEGEKKRELVAASNCRARRRNSFQCAGGGSGQFHREYKSSALTASHFATATLKGSRPMIVIDGVAGPTFDELIWISGDQFKVSSADGKPAKTRRELMDWAQRAGCQKR